MFGNLFGKNNYNVNEENIFSLRDKYILNNYSMNVLVLGGTGSGKTATILLPILNSIIKFRYPCLVIDVKNNFIDNLYKLEKLYMGKNNISIDSKIIEIGNFKTANNINLINGLSKNMVKKILVDILKSEIIDEKVSYWIDKGINIMEDIIDVYYFLYSKGVVEKPSLYQIFHLTNNYQDACLLWGKYISYKDDINVINMINKIQNDQFHIFSLYEDLILDEKSKNKKDTTIYQQLSWTIGQINIKFNKFTDPLMVEKFSNIDNEKFKLDFEELYYELNSIIAIRFSYEYNEIGNIVSTFIKIKSTKDIQNFQNKYPNNDRYVFTVIDEFQDIVSFSGTYQDQNWFDRCRSFKNINIVATQSISSLLQKSSNTYAVNTLIANCRNKILLNNDEPNTVNYFKDFEGLNIKKINLIDLEKPKMIYFCSKERKIKETNLNLNNKIEQTLKNIENDNHTSMYFYNEDEINLIDQKVQNRILKSLFELNFELKTFINDIKYTFEYELNIDEPNLFFDKLILENYSNKKIIDLFNPLNDFHYENIINQLDLENKTFINDIIKKVESFKIQIEKNNKSNKETDQYIVIDENILSKKDINVFYTGYGVAKNDFEVNIDKQFKDKINYIKLSDFDTLKGYDNSINIFVIGGNNRHLSEIFSYIFLHKCKNIIQQSKNSNSILGLGHSDFNNSITSIADFNLTSPTHAGIEINKLLIEKNKIIEKENKAIAILNKLSKLIETTKTSDTLNEFKNKVEKIGFLNYIKNLNVRLNSNHTINKDKTKNINNIDYLDYSKISEKEIDNLDFKDIEAFEYKNEDNSIDVFETKNLNKFRELNSIDIFEIKNLNKFKELNLDEKFNLIMNKIKSNSYKEITNDHIDSLNKDLDKKMIELIKENKFEEMYKILVIKENIINKILIQDN